MIAGKSLRKKLRDGMVVLFFFLFFLPSFTWLRHRIEAAVGVKGSAARAVVLSVRVGTLPRASSAPVWPISR